MNFYDKVHELAKSFTDTDEYIQYMKLKNEIKKDKKSYEMLKSFKDKQREQQLRYVNYNEISKEEQSDMQNTYSILIQNEKIREFLEYEMKLNVMLLDMQKIMGETVKEIVEF